MKRALIIVLDSAGCGAMPDSEKYGDIGVNTIGHIIEKEKGIKLPNLKERGLYKILGLSDENNFMGSFGKMSEKSVGKDTVIGHWEIAGIITEKPLPTYPAGFPKALLEKFEKAIGKRTIGNFPCSGTEILNKLGEEHVKTGFPIVYTSADSVFQIAAHEEVIPLVELYEICKKARELLIGEHSVGRVIARPFIGKVGEYKRTTNRKDFALPPQKETILDLVKNNDGIVSGIGKIYDIFVGKSVTESEHIDSNKDGILKMLQKIERKNEKLELLFTNLVDFDMVYGHRRDVPGYGRALEEFDSFIPEIESKMKEDDILFITADHGCDPTYLTHTDHTREYAPIFVSGKKIKNNNNLGILESFSDIAKTIADYFGLNNNLAGKSILKDIINC